METHNDFSTEKVLTTHFYKLPAAFFNITPKPDMLQISFFVKNISVIMPKKRNKFYIGFL